MRLTVTVLCMVVGFVEAGTIGAFTDGADEQRGDAAPAPYSRHRDTHYGHNHVYPDRGAIIRELPPGAITVNYAGVSYRFADGIWFEPRGPVFIVIAPPIGLLVSTLPPFATSIQNHGETYLYSNEIYYRARPDLGGFEVVNDPEQTSPDTAAGAAPAVPAGIAGKSVATAFTLQTASIATDVPVGAVAVPLAASAPKPQPSMVAAAPTNKVIAYPKNGQTAEQQARDHYDCYRFGVDQSGFDPMSSGAPSAPNTERHSDFNRAQTACLEGRGYTVR